jgi:hypothetical protein
MPNPSDLKNRRAQRSIELYHLNEDEVVKLRSVVQKQVVNLIRLGDALAADGRATSIDSLAVVKESIEAYLASDAHYVSMTRLLVRSVKGRGESWLDEVREIEMPFEFPT